MSKWIQKTAISTTSTGTDATISFSAAAAGSVLVAVAASNTVLSTPSGWTLVKSAVGAQALYLWTKTATSGENQLTTTRSVADIAIQTIVYELPATSSVITSTADVDFSRSGVAVPGLTGLPSDTKLLMHFASYAPTTPSVQVDANFDDATVVDEWVKTSDSSFTIMLLSGYIEDSTSTSWAPRVLISDTTDMGYSSQRITIAFSVPPQLPTPVLTISSQQNPSSIGGSDGAITVTWSAVAGAGSYTAGIADGYDQTGSFTTVSTNATSPYTFTGLSAGQYTIAIRAEP
jgi:hypothetical protein